MRKLLTAALLVGLVTLPAVHADEPKPAAPPAAAEKTLEQKIADAKKAGYRIVDRDGATMYCRTRMKTGSRVVKETECVTEAELETLGEASRRGLADMARQRPPPQGK